MIGVGQVINALNYLSAIDYNQKKYYSGKAIRIIQKRIGATETGVWDFQSITAVYNWQKSVMRLRPLTADGKFGPGTLGILIEELAINGHDADADFLARYKHKDKYGNIVKNEPDPVDRPVISFFQYPSTKLDIRPDPVNNARWIMKGSFKVEVFMDKKLPDPTQYEYRQYIKGRVFVHDGYFGDPINNTHWQARAGTREQEQNDYIKVPGGLSRLQFTEDGEVMPDNSVEKFGYRSSPYKWEDGIMDFYSNDQKGTDYRLQDTFGISGPRRADPQGGFKTGLKVGVELYFRGIVIKDGKTPTTAEINSPNWRDYCVEAKEWMYKGVSYVTW